MNNTSLKVNYEAEKELQRKYEVAESEDVKKAVQEEYKALSEKIAAKGDDYWKMYQLYSDMCDRKNDYIDIDDINENQVKTRVEMFRKYGIKKFTFSSTWSSAVKNGWAFTQNGCQIAGMVEINGTTKKFMSDEYEKVPAYVFVVE